MATVMMMVGGYAVSGDSWKWLMIVRKVVEGGKSHLHFQPILPRKWPWRVFVRDRWRHKMKLWNIPGALQLRANGHHYGGGSATLSDRCWKQKNTNSFLCFIFPPCGVNGHFEWRVSLGIHLFSSVLALSSNNKFRKSLALVATAGQSNTFVLVSCPTRPSYISTSQEQRNMARDVLHLYCLVVISSPNKSSKSLTLVAKPYICTDFFHFPFISIL